MVTAIVLRYLVLQYVSIRRVMPCIVTPGIVMLCIAMLCIGASHIVTHCIVYVFKLDQVIKSAKTTSGLYEIGFQRVISAVDQQVGSNH